ETKPEEVKAPEAAAAASASASAAAASAPADEGLDDLLAELDAL
ncbi:regulator, partial [Salmonella enterica subsp. enterica serovar Braenderup]|nr:regulator [Salmonella enterica subsp. enterica serovar Braenderup]